MPRPYQRAPLPYSLVITEEQVGGITDTQDRGTNELLHAEKNRVTEHVQVTPGTNSRVKTLWLHATGWLS